MAGTYPDIPGTRFALDLDGSVMKWRNYSTGSAWTDISGSLPAVQMISTASYADLPASGSGGQFAQVVIAFPEARNISGIYIHPSGSINYADPVATIVWEYSLDTTDGTDGAWAAFTASFVNFSSHSVSTSNSRPYYRSDIAPASLVNVKGIRVRWNGGSSSNYRLYVYHIYGSRPLTSVDRLAFWHPTLDQAIAPAALDLGDIPQGNSGTRQFRVKNLSATLTANTIDVQLSDPGNLYDTGELEVSNDNTTFAETIAIGTLAPGVISGVKYLRRTVPANEVSTMNHARLITNAASWT